MKTIFWYVITVIIYVTHATKPFPKIPETYKTGIEVKTYWDGRYMIFDGKEARKMNRYSIHYELFHVNERPNKTRSDKSMKSILVIFDYDENVVRSIDVYGGRKKCRRVFNVSMENWTRIEQIDAPAVTTLTLLGKEEDRNYTYVGMAMVRNMSCHHWQRSIANEQVDYYFKENDEGNMILLRIMESNHRFHRHSIYDYFSFTNVLPAVNELNVPMGTYCKVKNPIETPKLPNKITLAMEYRPLYNVRNRTNGQMIIGFKLFWDPLNRRVRRDHHIRINKKWLPVKDITDSNNELHYQLFSSNRCNITRYDPAGESMMPYFKNRGHWIHLQKTIEHYRENWKDFVFEGQHVVRGVLTNVWIYKSENLGREGFNEIEWYFTQPNTSEFSSTSTELNEQVPVRIVGYYKNQTEEYFEMDIFDFKHNVDDEDFTEPIKSCLRLKPGTFHTVALGIDGIPSESWTVMKDLTSLKNSSTYFVQRAAGLTEGNRIMSEIVMGSENIMLVLDIIDYPMQQIPQTPLAKDIVKSLKNEIKRKKLKFTFRVGNKAHEAKIVLIDGSNDEGNNDDDDGDGKDNVVIGLGITVVVVCILSIVGTLAVLEFVARRKGKIRSLRDVLTDKKQFQNEEVGPGSNGATTTSPPATEMQ